MSEIVVAKFGSNLLSNQAGLNSQAIFEYAAGLTTTYYDLGKSLVVVTSGAVAAGKHRAETIFEPEDSSKMTPQQHAALGATVVFNAWEQSFEGLGLLAGSIPVTHRQLGDKSLWRGLFNAQEKLSFRATLLDNCKTGIVTIINEADAISNTELMKLKCGGDNDGLASHLAVAIGAETLTLFTKKGGIFDDDNNLIEKVSAGNIEAVRAIAASRSVGGKGRGGLATKIEAAWDASIKGVQSNIAAVNADMSGEKITRFVVG